jgi:hypothetical protein
MELNCKQYGRERSLCILSTFLALSCRRLRGELRIISDRRAGHQMKGVDQYIVMFGYFTSAGLHVVKICMSVVAEDL